MKKRNWKKLLVLRGVWTHDHQIRRRRSYHWAKIQLEKFGQKLMSINNIDEATLLPNEIWKISVFPNEIWKISVFSAGCRHFWIFFVNLDWFNNFASKRFYEVSWCINFKIFCAHISAGCQRNEKINVNSKRLVKIPNMVKIWWTVHFFYF